VTSRTGMPRRPRRRIRDAPGMAELVLAERLQPSNAATRHWAPGTSEACGGASVMPRLSDYGVGRMCFCMVDLLHRRHEDGRLRPQAGASPPPRPTTSATCWYGSSPPPAVLNAAFLRAANVADVIQLPNK
jgi:hypothetical protein